MFNLFKKKSNNIELNAFIKGELKPITEVPDPVFAEKMMGDGIAIVPDKNDGVVCAPCDGEISLVMPSKHAVGIVMENGIEILLHLGLETCSLDGSGFDVFVKVGDKVTAKQKIAVIKDVLFNDENINMISMMIITKADNYAIKCTKLGPVTIEDKVVELVRS